MANSQALSIEDIAVDIGADRRVSALFATSSSSIAIPCDVDSEIDSNDHVNVISVKDVTPSSARRPWRDLLTNELFCARLIVLITAVFILFLIASYTVSLTVSLTLDNYWCDTRTLQEIREHSQEIGASGGVRGQCWDLGDQLVNEDKLWSKQSYEYQIDGLSHGAGNLLRFSVFLLLATVLLYYIMDALVRLIVDIRRYRTYKLKASSQGGASGDTTGCKRCMRAVCCLCIRLRETRLVRWYKKHFPVDSGNWIIAKMSSEATEIMLQTQALLIYNGTNLLSSRIS